MFSVTPALRSLRRSPVHVAIVTATLALGIGVNTAMFSVINAVLFRAGPFPRSEELVQITASTLHGELREFAEAEQREIRAAPLGFAWLSSIGRTFYALSEPGRPAERITAVMGTADMFATFGVRPFIGRIFTEEETRQGANQVVVLSHRYWQQHYAGSVDVLGRTFRLDGELVTVIGVMPASFDYPALWGNAAFWRPLNFTHDQLFSRDYRPFLVIGRLAETTSKVQIAERLGPLAEVQQREHPQAYAGLRYRIVSLQEALLDDSSRRMYWMLVGLAGFVLLIACANVANLQLARALSAGRDLAIRAALGASRADLMGRQLVESIILGLAGGGGGLAIGHVINRAIEDHALIVGFSDVRLSLDGRILALTLALSVLTGVAFGIIPAWLTSRINLSTALKQQARGSSVSKQHHVLRRALIVGQIALTLALLYGAVVMQRGFSQLLKRNAGWDTERVLMAALPISESRFDTEPKRYVLFHRIEQRLAAIPGVERAAVCSSLPLENYTGERPIQLEGWASGTTALDPRAHHVMVTAGYFETLGIPFVEGRNFSPDLKESDPLQIIVNETLARQLFPGKSPLGHRIRTDDSGYITWSEIIGVVRDVDTVANFSKPSTRLHVYKPLVHEPWCWVNLVVRGSNPSGFREEIRKAVAEVDPDLAVDQVCTVRQFIDERQRNLFLAAKLLSGFAGLGLTLAAIGLYSVISQTVVQRSGEFSIRLALGAPPAAIRSLVLKEGILLAAVGVLCGLAGAAIVARGLAATLPRLRAADPLMIVLIPSLLVATALLACWAPAWRASRCDPLKALQAE